MSFNDTVVSDKGVAVFNCSERKCLYKHIYLKINERYVPLYVLIDLWINSFLYKAQTVLLCLQPWVKDGDQEITLLYVWKYSYFFLAVLRVPEIY